MKVYTQFGLGIKVIRGSQLPAVAALSLRKSILSTCNESHCSQNHPTHSSTQSHSDATGRDRSAQPSHVTWYLV